MRERRQRIWFQSATRTTDDYGARFWADLSLEPSGYELCKSVKKASPSTPVLLLSSLASLVVRYSGSARQIDAHRQASAVAQPGAADEIGRTRDLAIERQRSVRRGI